MSVERRRTITPKDPGLSVGRQCALVSISRSGFYYRPTGESPANLAPTREVDVVFMECPFYGTRQMTRHLRRLGYAMGRKRVTRLMALMGLSAIKPVGLIQSSLDGPPTLRLAFRGF